MADREHDFSEYKATDREIYYARRRGNKDLFYDYFDNEVRFIPDKKHMWLRVDNGKEDFIMCDIMEESDEQHGLKPDVLTEEELREYAEDDAETQAENAEWVKYFEEKYNIDFEKQEYIFRKDSDSDEIPLPMNNVLCGCNIKLNVGEGILDFIYADFETPYKENYMGARLHKIISEAALENISDEYKAFKEEMLATYGKTDHEPRKILSKADLIYDKYLRYRSTVGMIKEISYASLYTAICPPVFNEHHEYEAYKIYFSYLCMLQKEFLELIEFCFDDEFYPEIFAKYPPHERFHVYTHLTDRPIRFFRDETFMTTAKGSYGMYLKEGWNEKEIIKRLSAKIETSQGIIDLSEKYSIEQEKLKALITIPKFVDKYYDFSTVSEILELEFTKMLEMDIRFRKCKWCGKYFIVKGNHGTKYCDRVAEGKTQSCQKLAALDEYKRKNANNEAKKVYDKYYKRYSARLKVFQIKEKDFKQWQYKAITMRDECIEGKITLQEYIDWNEAAFPNRTKKS